MSSSIVGLGTATPVHSVQQPDALAMSMEVLCEEERQRRFLSVLFHQSGVLQRHTVIPWQTAYRWREKGPAGPGTRERMELYEQHAAPLALNACRRLRPLGQELSSTTSGGNRNNASSDFDSASVSPSLPPELTRRITHLIIVTCTGFSAPGLDMTLVKELGLSDEVQRLQIGFMGCQGAMNGLRAARGLAAADPDALVLLVAVELCSLHYQMSWKERALIGNALFADGAAAALVAGSDSPESNTARMHLLDSASIRLPNTEDQMSWTIGDHGFEMMLDGKVPASLEQSLSPWMDSWLAKHGLSRDEIQNWVIHPGGPRILDATQSALGLDDSHLRCSREVLRDRGNMSSPTVLFVLEQALHAASPRSGGPTVMLAFGPGLVAEATLLGPPSWHPKV